MGDQTEASLTLQDRKLYVRAKQGLCVAYGDDPDACVKRDPATVTLDEVREFVEGMNDALSEAYEEGNNGAEGAR